MKEVMMLLPPPASRMYPRTRGVNIQSGATGPAGTAGPARCSSMAENDNKDPYSSPAGCLISLAVVAKAADHQPGMAGIESRWM